MIRSSGSPIHLFVKRFPISEVPSEPKDLVDWIYNLYKQKDDKIAQFKKDGKWPEKVCFILPHVTVQGAQLATVSWSQHFGLFAVWACKWLVPPLVVLFNVYRLVRYVA